MGTPSGIRRSVAICLCWSFLIPMMPPPAQAIDPYKFVIVKPGQPTIWSLGQAHYLLANMHQRNRDLSTRLPNENDLDPNRANASRLEALRRALRFEAQFDESIGAKNDLETERFRREEVRQENARITLEERRQERTRVENELLVINEELTRLQELDRQSTETRGRTTPPTPPSAEDNERKLRIELLKVRKAQKDTEKARLDSEITALTTTATTNPTLPTFQTAPLSEGSGGLPQSAAFDKFVTDALEGFSSPTLAASTALDNFVQMQYEIISKQLTLLRDETGPDERIIFLELPASIYSADGWGDDYVAEVEWEVTQYFDKAPPKEIRDEVMKAAVEKSGKLADSEMCKQGEDIGNDTDLYKNCPITLEMIQIAANRAAITNRPLIQAYETERQQYEAQRKKKGVGDPPKMPTLDDAGGKKVLAEGGFLRVRALDIIPRQSALNVNQHHATVKNVGILGFLKFLSGFGAKVDFQNQKELYEQFLQQEVFASGYGKGTNTFGWTFGPLPGSKRVAPGQRTTYAVLAVPRDTLALELLPKHRVFRRNQIRPPKAVEADRIIVRVPGPQTDGFWISEASYTPAPKGKRASVVLEGLYFSPQLGILVNGTPLQRVVSITRSGSKEEPALLAVGIHGEYELTNSRQVVLSFSMGSDYTGTPVITLVTPDKSAPINFFKVKVNGLDKTSLDRLSTLNPMFTDELEVAGKLEVIRRPDVLKPGPDSCTVKYVLARLGGARLGGKGLRPKARIYVNNRELPVDLRDPETSLREGVGHQKEFAVQESTGSYFLYFEDPGAEVAVRVHQPTRQGFEEKSFTHVFFTPFSHKLRHYRQGVRGNPSEVHLTFTDRDNTITGVSLTEPPLASCPRLERDDKSVLVTCLVPSLAGGMERDFIVAKVERSSAAVTVPPKFVDITLPVQARVATVVNPRTGNASGFADEQPYVTISGFNLHNVTAVIFGEQVVKLSASGSREMIMVRVPKAEGIPPGQSIVVPVFFQTSTDGEAKIPSGAFYTFFGPPLQPSYVTWPCVAGAPCPQPVGGKP